jgi:hypothetical protein
LSLTYGSRLQFGVGRWALGVDVAADLCPFPSPTDFAQNSSGSCAISEKFHLPLGKDGKPLIYSPVTAGPDAESGEKIA